MKKIYTRSNLLSVLLLLLIGTIVYSCRKDKQENLTELAISDQRLSQVKIWYDSKFNSSNSIPNNSAIHINVTNSMNPPSWDHILSPAWAKANTFVIGV